jgi:glycosyltransferase involved in cell wall biosynthesis
MSRILRIAMIAPYPASAVLPPELIRPKSRRGEHAAPWIRALCPALARRDDIILRVFVDSRAVLAPHAGREKGVDYFFVHKYETGLTDPFHFYWPATVRLRALIREFAPDLVHGFGAEGGHGLIATRFGRPSVVFIQGIASAYAPFLDGPRCVNALHKHIENVVARRATALVAETHFARDWALARNPQANVKIIPHGSNPEFFEVRPHYQSRQIVVIGALQRRKGVDVAIRAIARLSGCDLRLLIVGDGPEHRALLRLAHDLRVADRVTFTGTQERTRIISLMESSCALAMPTRMDTSPNVITEAHAAGLPVIGTKVGGVPEMIDDERDGFLVQADDVAALADRMERLVNDSDLCRRMGQTGREKVKQLNDPDRIASAHADLYREVINAGVR